MPYPNGFGSFKEYEAFAREIIEELRGATGGNVELGVQGSAATNESWEEPGTPFRAESDFDVAIFSETLAQRVKNHYGGYDFNRQGPVGPVTKQLALELGIQDFFSNHRAVKSSVTGPWHEVKFAIYEGSWQTGPKATIVSAISDGGFRTSFKRGYRYGTIIHGKRQLV